VEEKVEESKKELKRGSRITGKIIERLFLRRHRLMPSGPAQPS